MNYLKIRHIELHELDIKGFSGLHIWVSSAPEDKLGEPQYRFALPHDVAIECGTQIAFLAEKLKGQDFPP